MVPRYARPEMTAIWSAENRFSIWFAIEAHATDALAELGTVPQSAAKAQQTARPEGPIDDELPIFWSIF